MHAITFIVCVIIVVASSTTPVAATVGAPCYVRDGEVLNVCDRTVEFCDVYTLSCQPRKALGEQCGLTSGPGTFFEHYPPEAVLYNQCVDGTTCELGFCVSLPKLGEPCLTDRWCGAGSSLVCTHGQSDDTASYRLDHRCSVRAGTAVGELCTNSKQCAGGAFCDGYDIQREGRLRPRHNAVNVTGSRCHLLLANGADCVSHAECVNSCDQSLMYADQQSGEPRATMGVCRDWPLLGDVCVTSSSCRPDPLFDQFLLAGIPKANDVNLLSPECGPFGNSGNVPKTCLSGYEMSDFAREYNFQFKATCAATVNIEGELYRCSKYNDAASCLLAGQCTWGAGDSVYGPLFDTCQWAPTTPCSYTATTGATDESPRITMTFDSNGARIAEQVNPPFKEVKPLDGADGADGGGCATAASIVAVALAVVLSMSVASVV